MDHPDSPGVLVVDDETEVADLFTTWLSTTYSVETAYGGCEALRLLDETVDVMLLDRNMPGLTGADVLRAVRDGEFDCRVAMVTAIEPDAEVLEAGYDEYLTKPVTGDDLHDVVETLLSETQRGGSPEVPSEARSGPGSSESVVPHFEATPDEHA